MKDEELKQINGGGLSASYISVIIRGASTLYDLGKACGSALRYLKSGRKCS